MGAVFDQMNLRKDLDNSYITIFKYLLVMSFIASFIIILVINDMYEDHVNKGLLMFSLASFAFSIGFSGIGYFLTLKQKFSSMSLIPFSDDMDNYYYTVRENLIDIRVRKKVINLMLILSIAVLINGIIFSFIYTYSHIGTDMY